MRSPERHECSIATLPDTSEIQDVPQAPILSVLEHALDLACTCLSVEHPCLGRLGEAYAGRLPPRQILLAQMVADRCSELSNLIGWYRQSCPRSLQHGERDRYDFGEDEPF